MSTAHCLTVEVKGQSTPAVGVGYMITFTLPANMRDTNPESHPRFAEWAAAVRTAVLDSADLPFHGDTFTRKMALANLMHDLAEINRAFPLRIGGSNGVPAVQIHSTDPQARQIELDFRDEDGDFSVIERNPQVSPVAEVREQGRIGLMAAARKAFPFDKPAATPPKAAKNPPRPPKR